jgi:hypothetical protein
MKPVARETNRSPVKRVLFHPRADYALNARTVLFFPFALSTPLRVRGMLMRQRNSLGGKRCQMRHVSALLY